MRDGKIVDPTFPEKEVLYFPGLRFEGTFEISKALNTPKPDGADDLPIFYRFGWGGADSVEFTAARELAHKCQLTMNGLGGQQ